MDTATIAPAQPSIPKPTPMMDEKKAEAAAKDFEAVYISQMLTHMFEGIKTDGMFGGGNAENIFRSMMVDEYGKMLSQNGGIGIASSVQNEILQMQSQAQNGGIK